MYVALDGNQSQISGPALTLQSDHSDVQPQISNGHEILKVRAGVERLRGDGEREGEKERGGKRREGQ